jgi:hypothetical protein
MYLKASYSDENEDEFLTLANDDVYGLAADEDILTHWEDILPQCNYILSIYMFYLMPYIVF